MSIAPRLILASESETRRRLLANAGVTFGGLRPKIDEEALKRALIEDGRSPRDVALTLAEAKALSVSRAAADDLVLGADQVLALKGGIQGKPGSREAARLMLTALSDRRHELITAAVFARRGEVLWRHVETAALMVRPLSAAFIEEYLERAGDVVVSCAGGYQIEGLGAQLFAKVEGDHFAI